MTDTPDEKTMAMVQRTSSAGGVTSESQRIAFSRPAGWKYKGLKVFGYTLPWFASPKVQLALVAAVCFLTAGMFNAISGMGGGGRSDATTANHMVSRVVARAPSLLRRTCAWFMGLTCQ